MSTNWVQDMAEMHQKYGVNEWFEKHKDDKVLMNKYLMFRLLMCQEELHETMQAVNSGNSEEIVDGLIDLCVFAIGTLDVFNVDASKAWDEIYAANMNKQVGVKPGGWTPPSHEGNHGELDVAQQNIRDRTPIDRSGW